MSAVDTKFYQKKKQRILYVSLAFFISVLALSGGLYLYTMRVESENSVTDSEVKKIESSIAQLEAVDNIQSYKLFKRNQNFLKRMHCRSQVASFITHLRRTFTKYGFDAKGFSLADESVTTDISVASTETEKAYQKILKFLEEYPRGESALFSVDHIGNYSGYERIKFPLSLTFNQHMYENCSK